ncbi:MAG TPA: ADOP family duplicated permease [Vicinamibacterales bacterium]|nr:ADOP family duplicated permease [Vicinamibacterales bacterium]
MRPVWITGLSGDLRLGFRMLAKSPIFSITATSCMALGIGGAASVFTIFNAVILRTLPVPNPHQLFAVQRIDQDGDVNSLYAWPSFEEARDELRGRAELCASTHTLGLQLRVDPTSPARQGLVQLVSGEYFEVLRQRAQVGRLLGPADNARLGAHPVAVISDAFWERSFQRAPAAVGRQLDINGTSFTVVGIAPPRFFGTVLSLRNPDVWIPLMMQSAVRASPNASNSGSSDTRKPYPPQPEIEWLDVVARVPARHEPPAIGAVLTTLRQHERVSRLDPANTAERERAARERVTLEPAARGVSGLRTSLELQLSVLLGMVGVVVAIACGNVASLLLARAAVRDREIAIRLSLGAARWRVARQLLAEALLLAAAGGGLGLLAAAWGRDVLLGMFASSAATVDLDTSFDWRVLAFVVAVTMLTGLAAGVVPAWRTTRVPPAEALKLQSRAVGAAGRRGGRAGRLLVSAQITFCLVLLVVAGLFVRSMNALLQVDVGYDRAAVLVAQLDVRSLGYSAEQRQALYTSVIGTLAGLPGVASSSLSMTGPVGNTRRISTFSVEGYTPGRDERMTTNEEVVTEDYFSTVGLRLVEGRVFQPEDRRRERRATIVNETLAKRYFAGRSAIGKRWTYGGPIDADANVIVGVVRDARYVDLRGDVPNMAYRLSAASPDDVLASVEVRTLLPPAQMVPAVREALDRAVPALPVIDVVPIEHRIHRKASYDRLVANLSTTFGLVALALACLGLYGTVSCGVSRRIPEFGVRMALGAHGRHVVWLVLRDALMLVLAGGLLGVPLAFVAARGLRSMLYTVPATDPAVYSAGAALVAAVAGLAALLPAWRASRIEPLLALRKE